MLLSGKQWAAAEALWVQEKERDDLWLKQWTYVGKEAFLTIFSLSVHSLIMPSYVLSAPVYHSPCIYVGILCFESEVFDFLFSNFSFK